MEDLKLFMVSSVALMNAVTVGICSTYSSTATESMKQMMNLSEDDVSWIGSSLPLGAIVGGVMAGFISDKLGRKGVMMFISTPLLIGWLLICYAPSVLYIYAGRILTGLCVGCICVVTPMYIVEISTSEKRGNLGCRFQMFICLGIIYVSAFGFYFAWNWVALFASIFTVLTAVCMLFVPESPRWLLMKGDHAETVRAMNYLHGEKSVVLTANLVDLNQDEQRRKFDIREITQPTIYKPAILSVALMFFQQFSGSNAILYYTVLIFKQSNSSVDPSFANLIVAICMFLFTLIACFLMDRLGRKISLVLSGSVTCLSLNALSIYLYASHNNPSLKETLGWIPLLCLLIYISAFSLGLGPIPWLMMSEMSPTRARGFICGLGTAFSWIFCCIVTKTFISIEDVIYNFGSYWFYSFFCLAVCIFTIFMIPETKGKSLEEIEAYFLSTESSQILQEVTEEGQDRY